MSSRPLPQGGPERRIFLVGLRQLSDQCEAPALTPGCPFYEECAEQCIDLLADYGQDHRHLPRQDLGAGLEAVRQSTPRPRPRRSPEPDARPFDAAGIAFRDRDRPVEQRRATTLIKDIRDHLSTPPAFFTDDHERAYTITSSHEELNRRGVDADLLVRCGVAPRVEAGLLFSILAAEILNEAGIALDDELSKLPEPDPAWVKLLTEARAADGADDQTLLHYAATGAFGRRVRAWMATASLEDVVAWVAPNVDTFMAFTVSPWTPAETARAAWLMERFTETYLEEWSTDSLEMEWGYLHGEQKGCCPSDAMRERPTDRDEVARLLADRHHAVWKQHPTAAAERQFSAQDFTRAAAENLAAGRQEAAAAIFAAVLRLTPDSTEANNNYAFCILPTDPAKSLHHLEKAATTVSGKAIERTNAANRVLALHLLGRDDQALDLAEAALALPGPDTPSFLWIHGTGSLKLSDPVSPGTYLEQLHEHLRGDIRWGSCRKP